MGWQRTRRWGKEGKEQQGKWRDPGGVMEWSHGQAQARRRNEVEMKQREVWNGHGGAVICFCCSCRVMANVCIYNTSAWLCEGRGSHGRGTAHTVLWIEMLGLFPQPPWAMRGGKAPRGRQCQGLGQDPLVWHPTCTLNLFSLVLVTCPKALESWTEFSKVSEFFLPCSHIQVHPRSPSSL